MAREMWDVLEAMPSIVEATDVVEAFSRLRASAADRIERSCTRLEKDMVLIGVDVRRQGRLDGRLQSVGEGGINVCTNREDVRGVEWSQAVHQWIYVRRDNVGGRRFEVAKMELMGMFGSRRTKIGDSKRRRGM